MFICKGSTGLEKWQFLLEKPYFEAFHLIPRAINTKFGIVVIDTCGAVTSKFFLTQSYLIPIIRSETQKMPHFRIFRYRTLTKL